MREILEPRRSIPVRLSCDVAVAGGGIAGIAAALAAARAGAKVVLIEKEWVLGGLATLGLITIYLPLCDGRGKQVIYGIGEELLRLSICHGGGEAYPKAWLENGDLEEKKKHRFQVQYNPHLFAIEAERLLLEAGVRLLYGTSVCGVHRKGERIDALIIENKGGRSAIEAGSVVDCTGDADICWLSGAPTEIFAQKNVLASWYYYYNKGAVKLTGLGAAGIPEKYKTGKESRPLVDKRFTGLDGEELTEMVVLSHRELLKDILKHRQKEEDFIPVNIPGIPQIRMTRRMRGAYEMDDTEMHSHFEDSVGLFGDWRKNGPVYELPFRTLYCPEIKNLLSAGRCISVTDAMWDITRVIPVCAVSGEAAGTAAALGQDLSSLDIVRLQKTLRKNGVLLREDA